MIKESISNKDSTTKNAIIAFVILIAIGFLFKSDFMTYHLCNSPTSTYNPQGYKCYGTIGIPPTVLLGWFLIILAPILIIIFFWKRQRSH